MYIASLGCVTRVYNGVYSLPGYGREGIMLGGTEAFLPFPVSLLARYSSPVVIPVSLLGGERAGYGPRSGEREKD